jgi:NAD(P)-dependent dehydrogenase (short-subunit alcohol dehydrogenase family)
MNFEGRVALITGGTAGIGEATVRRISGMGARTVLSAEMRTIAGASNTSFSATVQRGSS